MIVCDVVRYGLNHVRLLWQAYGVWPKTAPQTDGLTITHLGRSPSDLESAACAECRANVWTTERGPYVAGYDTGMVYSYYCYDCYFVHRHRNGLEEVAGERSISFPAL